MKPLAIKHCDPAHYSRIHLAVDLPPEYTAEDVLNPNFWLYQTSRLKVGALIDVYSQDGKIDMLLRVTAVEKTYAKVRPIFQHVVSDEDLVKAPEVNHDLAVSYGGKDERWRVLHNGTVVFSKFDSKAEAEKAMRTYSEKLNA